jgi:NAD(P)-dependent dehydrogenase (short-subunit alcohol dehydrogenase family)
MNPQEPRQHQLALVTGGGRGIGAAIAARLSELGATVIVAGRTEKALAQTVAQITKAGGTASALALDVADLDTVQRAADRVQNEFGKLDVLVNNAGVGSFSSPLHQLDPAEWDRVMNINLRGVYYCIRAFTPLLMKSANGHIVNISSLAGKNALPNGAVYAASKWGLNGLSYSVAEELRGHGIRVSVVCPGSVDTELSPHAGKDKAKMLQSSDVAHAVAAIVTQAPQSFISELLVRPTQKP